MNVTLLPPPPMDETGLDMSQFRLYDPIIPLRSPMNRREKKYAEAEYAQLFRLLYPIEKAFTDNAISVVIPYEGAFDYCLKKFRAATIHVKKTIKPKWFTVNDKYFEISFKSIPSA